MSLDEIVARTKLPIVVKWDNPECIDGYDYHGGWKVCFEQRNERRTPLAFDATQDKDWALWLYGKACSYHQEISA